MNGKVCCRKERKLAECATTVAGSSPSSLESDFKRIVLDALPVAINYVREYDPANPTDSAAIRRAAVSLHRGRRIRGLYQRGCPGLAALVRVGGPRYDAVYAVFITV